MIYKQLGSFALSFSKFSRSEVKWVSGLQFPHEKMAEPVGMQIPVVRNDIGNTNQNSDCSSMPTTQAVRKIVL